MPMTELARQYGVRDLRIAQACDLHDVARPAAGYWQKLDFGKKVHQEQLENGRFAADNIVEIVASMKMPRGMSNNQTAGRSQRNAQQRELMRQKD